MHRDSMLLPLSKPTQHGVDGVLGLSEVLLTHVLEGTLDVAAKVLPVCVVLCHCWSLDTKFRKNSVVAAKLSLRATSSAFLRNRLEELGTAADVFAPDQPSVAASDSKSPKISEPSSSVVTSGSGSSRAAQGSCNKKFKSHQHCNIDKYICKSRC